jgi:hypothetical protein
MLFSPLCRPSSSHLSSDKVRFERYVAIYGVDEKASSMAEDRSETTIVLTKKGVSGACYELSLFYLASDYL